MSMNNFLFCDSYRRGYFFLIVLEMRISKQFGFSYNDFKHFKTKNGFILLFLHDYPFCVLLQNEIVIFYDIVNTQEESNKCLIISSFYP